MKHFFQRATHKNHCKLSLGQRKNRSNKQMHFIKRMRLQILHVSQQSHKKKSKEFQYLFMMKVSTNQIQKISHSIIKATRDAHCQYHTLGEEGGGFPSRSGAPTIATSDHYSTEHSGQINSVNKWIMTSEFKRTTDAIFLLENTKHTKKFKLINAFSKIEGYKINI